MQKSIQVANRRFMWVKEQPGPILVLFIALCLMFSAHFLLDSAPASVASDIEAHDPR